MDIILNNQAIFAGLCGVTIALINLIKLAVAARDRAAHRASVAALAGNSQALEALAHSEPPPGEVQSGPLVMLALCFASALCSQPALAEGPAPIGDLVSVGGARPPCGPCEPPAKCVGRTCTGSAKQPTPRPPRKREERVSDSRQPVSDWLVRREDPPWAVYLPES